MGTLYLVATPIGNLEDVTLRALRVLGEADWVLAEDTRRTRVLLEHHGIEARPRALHAHNEASRTAALLRKLERGAQMALVCDAGTPLLSDPGERLVARAIAAGHTVTPLPGASAPLAALVASGLPVTPFTMCGFLPRKLAARRAALAALAKRPETLVILESPRRLATTLTLLADIFGAERPACVARELTKLHEAFSRGTLGVLRQRFAAGARGEVTLVVAGAPEAAPDPEALRARVRAELEAGRSARDLASALHAATGVARRVLYQLALEEKRRSG